VREVVDAFRSAGGEGKPVMIQDALSWAPSEDEAFEQAIGQWAGTVAGGEVNWDLRRPKDFDVLARMVGRKEIAETVAVSPELSVHAERIAGYGELKVDTVFLHNVGTNQRQFLDAFGAKILPQFRV
jgi:hypothetical protein